MNKGHMTFHISIEAAKPVDFYDQMEKITKSVLSGDIEDHQLMDGSYQIGTSNIEIYEQNDEDWELESV